MSESETNIRLIEDQEDVDDILEIIEDHDEDDAKYARKYYKRWLSQQSDFHQDMVFTVNDEIVAVTGFSYDESTDGTFWLAWTYTDYDYHGQGFGTQIVQEALARMEAMEGRKLYLSTSDYVDFEDGRIYQKAMDFYKSLGFVTEFTLKDYHQVGESKILMGRGLSRYNPHHKVAPPATQETSFTFTDIELAGETEDVYYINWVFAKATSYEKNMDQLLALEGKLRKKKARKAYITCSNRDQPLIQFLRGNSYHEAGRLRDYFADGEDEVHFFFDIR